MLDGSSIHSCKRTATANIVRATVKSHQRWNRPNPLCRSMAVAEGRRLIQSPPHDRSHDAAGARLRKEQGLLRGRAQAAWLHGGDGVRGILRARGWRQARLLDRAGGSWQVYAAS